MFRALQYCACAVLVCYSAAFANYDDILAGPDVATASLWQFAQKQDPVGSLVPNVRQLQEWLVWSGYYDGPLDGDAGPGTIAAVKRFQHDAGVPETGSLGPPQLASVAKRANAQISLTGYAVITDSRTGVRVGLPLSFVPQKKGVLGGTDFTSQDDKIRIGLRTFKTDSDFRALYDQFRDTLKGSRLPYTVYRPDWMVITGDNDTKRFYIRYYKNNDIISGIFSIYDKDLSKDVTGPLTAAISMMSLTMQPFSITLDTSLIPKLAGAAIMEPILLLQGSASSLSAVSPSISSKDGAGTPSSGPLAQNGAGAQRPADPPMDAAQRRIMELEKASAAADLLAKKKIADADAARRRAEVELAAQRSAASNDQRNTQPSQVLLLGGLGAAVILLSMVVIRLSKNMKVNKGISAASPSENAQQIGVTAPAGDAEKATHVAAVAIDSADSEKPVPVSVLGNAPSYEGQALTSPPLTPMATTRIDQMNPTRQTLLAVGGLVSVGLLIIMLVSIVSKAVGL